MKIIYCIFTVNNKMVDPDYKNEYDSALKNGFDIQEIPQTIIKKTILMNLFGGLIM